VWNSVFIIQYTTYINLCSTSQYTLCSRSTIYALYNMHYATFTIVRMNYVDKYKHTHRVPQTHNDWLKTRMEKNLKNLGFPRFFLILQPEWTKFKKLGWKRISRTSTHRTNTRHMHKKRHLIHHTNDVGDISPKWWKIITIIKTGWIRLMLWIILQQ